MSGTIRTDTTATIVLEETVTDETADLRFLDLRVWGPVSIVVGLILAVIVLGIIDIFL